MHFGRTSLAMAVAVAASFAMAACGHSDALAQNSAQNAKLWRVTQVDGDAWLRNRASAARPVHEGDRLVAGGFVVTGEAGKVVLSRDVIALTLMPNSRIEIPADDPPLADGPPDDAHPGRISVVQRFGTLMVQLEQYPGRLEDLLRQPPEGQVLQVETPFLTASVMGTVFTVRVEEGAASLNVTAGTVEVRSIASGEVAIVRAGQTARVSQSRNGRLQVIGAD